MIRIKSWLVGAAAVSGVLMLGSAVAKFPPYGVVYDVTYFSDNSYTLRVGGERWTCTRYMSVGEKTLYKIEKTWPCDSGGSE